MCSSHRPTEGADSEPIPEDPPLVELPRAHPALVAQYVREAMPPGTPESVIADEVTRVLAGDALGRAIHQAKQIGGPWPAPCVRIRASDGAVEAVPYGYGTEHECECEAMALHLLEIMAAQGALAQATGRLVIASPKEMH